MISRQDGAVMSIMFTITLNNFSKCQVKHFFVSEFPFKGFVCPQIEEKNMHGYLFLIGNLYRFYFNLLTVLGEYLMFSLTDTRETVVTVQDAYLIG